MKELLIGHRGEPETWPENSREGFEAVLRAGARFIETDVQITSDGVAILSHDPTLLKVTGLNQAVAETDYRTIRSLSAGYPERFGEKFRDCAIMRLDEFAVLLKQYPQAKAFVEIKHGSIRAFGNEFVVDTVLAALAPVLEQVIIISFEHDALVYVRKACDLPIGWVLPAWSDENAGHARQLAPEYLFCNRKRLPPESEPLWAGPWKWAVYTINDSATIEQLRARGVDMVETNVIRELLTPMPVAADRACPHYDVVIIGGGIQGVGAAQAAACAGHSVLLIEKTSLAAGTSSRSSKLIHGGLRYLEGLDFGLVHESLTERAILRRIAPELVQLRPFHIPVYAETSRRPLTLWAGLSLYAVLGRLRASTRFKRLGRDEWGALDGLKTDGLQAVFRYYDAQTNDAVLTRSVMRSAIDHGAQLVCPAEFLTAHIHEAGAEICYREGSTEKSCSASVMINAAGPWVNSVAGRIRPLPRELEVDLVQGAHLVLEEPLQENCYYMEVPQDGRAVFLLPWGEHSMLGTTEHVYHGDPGGVHVLEEEEEYLLQVLSHYFPDRSHKVRERFAGLRVLPVSADNAFKRSRETQLPVDNPQRPRLVSIYGGKLTGYRATAEKIMKLFRPTLPERNVVADTARLMLVPD